MTTSSEEIGARVRARLLAAPSYTGEDLPASRGEPPAHLIRLAGPDGTSRYPAFQFNQWGLPLPVVLTVNEILRAGEDPWGVADWWLSVNSWLARPPVELLGQGRDQDLVALARAVRGAV